MNNTGNREIVEIRVEDIVPNRFQPRLTFDMEALNDLANSIKEHGIIQPLVVRRLQDKYEIIAGERRYKAATLIGMQKVPCIIMNLNDNESAEVAVIENIQRKEMTSLEEAKSFKKLLDKGYLTQDDLAKRMGKSQSAIANKLRLLNLDEVVQDAILNNKISERHARSLLRIQNKEDQRKILSEIVEKRLTVRQTDDLIKEKYERNNNNMENNNSVINPTSINEAPLKMSVPEVNIPINNITGDINPQLNILHNMGNIDEPKNMNTSNLDSINPNIFRAPIENNNLEQKTIENDIPRFFNTPIDNNNNLNMYKPEDNTLNNEQSNINNIINPSVFSNNNPNINKPPMFNEEPKESVLVDINQIKQQAEDINPTNKYTNDISSLLQSETPKPENKFFMDLDFNDEILDLDTPKENVSKNVVDAINKNLDQLQQQGNKIHKEERDLGNAYQITIIIDK